MQREIIIPKGYNKEIIDRIGWTPALKVGNEVLVSAIGGTAHPELHIFTVGETIEDQCHMILEHLEDIMEQAGGTLDNVVDITVYVRPVVTDADMKLAAKIISAGFNRPAPTETWTKSDFAGATDELIQLKARAILTS